MFQTVERGEILGVFAQFHFTTCRVIRHLAVIDSVSSGAQCSSCKGEIFSLGAIAVAAFGIGALAVLAHLVL